MDDYFLVVTAIDVVTLGIMCVLTKNNETLNRHQRKWFTLAFLLVMATSILEVITIAVNHKPAALRGVNILANYLGFGLSPAIAVFLANAFGLNQRKTYALLAEGAYLLFLAFPFSRKLIFSVSPENEYMRGDCFIIFPIVYFASICYLFVITIRATRAYQNRSKNIIYFIAVFALAGTTVQVVFPHMQTTGLCVSLLSILFFTYCNNMWQQLDQLTGLLNQNSYLNKTASLSQNGTLLVFDIDDFKQINDHYGHVVGDSCLAAVAACIKKAYFGNGFCYRIGGDEFCVLLNEGADERACYQNFVSELDNFRKTQAFLPYVSVGSAPFSAGDYLLEVKEKADQNMYQFKNGRKMEQKKQGGAS